MRNDTLPVISCTNCGLEKPTSEFYDHPFGLHGVMSKCKECHRAYMITVRNANLEKYRSYDRKRAQDPKRKKAYGEKSKRLRSRPGVMRAHNLVTRAVRSGKLIRPSSCERCGTACKPNAHHDDYFTPLSVMWLCPICHAARHRELGRLKTIQKFYGETTQVTTPVDHVPPVVTGSISLGKHP